MRRAREPLEFSLSQKEMGVRAGYKELPEAALHALRDGEHGNAAMVVES